MFVFGVVEIGWVYVRVLAVGCGCVYIGCMVACVLGRVFIVSFVEMDVVSYVVDRGELVHI